MWKRSRLVVGVMRGSDGLRKLARKFLEKMRNELKKS